MDRRNFFKTLGMGSVALAAQSVVPTRLSAMPQTQTPVKPETNIAKALAYPRTASSMPGRYPGKVVKCYNEACFNTSNVIDYDVVYKMLSQGMLALTGASSLKEAWLQFVGPNDRIGLKVNPIAGPTLSTSHELTKAVIKQLEDAGIPRKQITIWDRREVELHEAGFTEQNYPGIRIMGTEYKENDSYYGPDGKLLGLNRIDSQWYYEADCEEAYDAYTMPYMINEGKHSFFSTIVTRELDKIINIPIMKNAGTAATLCMKNLAFGSISNTSRLHKMLWGDTCAQVPAFPPLRDKVVLNIADGFQGCYDGGPAANPQFICRYNTLLLGSDPVAVDRIGHDIIIGKRIAMGRQKADTEKGIAHLVLAQQYGLGIAQLDQINLITV